METVNWSFDPMHSELRFKIRHLMIASVSGSFKNFDVKMRTSGEDIATASIEVTADIDSVTTGNEQRDGHLKKGDFFEADKYPRLRFISGSIGKIDEENYTIYGDLTMKGVTRPVQLKVEYSGM